MYECHPKGNCVDIFGVSVIFNQIYQHVCLLFVCWSLTSLCHSNGHIETMPAREINPSDIQTLPNFVYLYG